MKKIKIKKFRDQKLNTKFTVVIITSLLVIIGIFSGILFYNMERNVVTESEDYTAYTLQRSVDGMSTGVDSLNMVTQFFLSNKSMKTMLANTKNEKEVTAEQWLDFNNTTIVELERLINSNPLLHGVRVFSSTDNVEELMPVLYKHNRMSNMAWADSDDIYGWHFNYPDNLFASYSKGGEQKIASLITSLTVRGEGEVGVIEASISMKDLFPVLYDNPDGEWGFILTEDGEYYSGYDSADIEEILPEVKSLTENDTSDVQTVYLKRDGKYMMVAVSPVHEMAVDIVFVKDITDRIHQVRRTRNIFIAVISVFFILLTIGIDGIVRLLLKQFYEILGNIRKIQNGDLDTRITVYNQDEMGELSVQLNTMLDVIQTLMQDNIDREVLVKNSQIRALQNQINAHFIYNILETIKMMAEIDEEYTIADAITSLGKLLRYSIRWTSGNVKVEDELNYIQNYVALINLRFDYEIILSVNMPERMAQQDIPKMSLQPIVENAILHGIEELAEDTTIYIKGFYKENDCIIEITDNGKGMSPEQVKRLEQKIAGKLEASGGNSKSNGIGLKNVEDRIHIAFGNNYGLSFVSEEGKYTKVIIRIPDSNEKSDANEQKKENILTVEGKK